MAVSRITIQDVTPQVDCGRWPAKACLGDSVQVAATIVRDGHEVVRASVRHRPAGARGWRETPLEPIGNDRFECRLEPDALGRWEYRVHAWLDPYASWLDEYRPQARRRPARSRRRAVRGRAPVRAWHGRGVALGSAGARLEEACRGLAVGEARARRRARARALWRVVRALPPLVGRLPRRCESDAPARRARVRRRLSAPRRTRSAASIARAATTPSGRRRETPAARGRSAPPRAATTPSTRSSARWRTSSGS